MFDKFLEQQAKRFIADSRDKLEEFLSTHDVDKNGEKDREQLLKNFDEFTQGLHEVVKSGTNITQLLVAYYNTFGPKDEATLNRLLDDSKNSK